jgi:SAM-dependent MidA family methyltransferase
MSEPSPLENEIRRLIAVAGPMPIARYMSLCLTHPSFGYYITRDPFGPHGDFTTAPEVSQIFGELLGLWALSVWRMMDEPQRVNLVELGPGRGTMMRDALRAARVLPAFRNALSVHMVEISPTLEQVQRYLGHESIESTADGLDRTQEAEALLNALTQAPWRHKPSLPRNRRVRLWHFSEVAPVAVGDRSRFQSGL